MKLILDILRQSDRESAPYRERIEYRTAGEEDTVATALRRINAERTQTGEARIRWECGCLQKKCGACAMRINAKACLACDYSLRDCREGDVIRIEPLRKFPVIADLIVDRSVIAERAKALKLWLEGTARIADPELAYEGMRCLQCGCCLEVCPNYDTEGDFAGAAALTEYAALSAGLPEEQQRTLYQSYEDYVYEGCGKALSCQSVCPAGIDTQHLLVRANARAVWRRRR